MRVPRRVRKLPQRPRSIESMTWECQLVLTCGASAYSMIISVQMVIDLQYTTCETLVFNLSSIGLDLPETILLRCIR